MSPAGPTIDEKVAALREPAAYAGLAQTVEVRETHMSWVFLTENFVFKLKKPVRFPYLDFSTLSKRHNACRAEVDLNRRLAPGVYLGVTPLSVSRQGLIVGEGEAVVDYLVKMRRLNEGRMLDNLIKNRLVDRHSVDTIAKTLSEFYLRATPVPIRKADFLRHWSDNLRQNLAGLMNPRFRLPQATIRRCDRVLREFLRACQPLLLERLRRRHIVDGHGDLRPEHIWLGDEVKIIDCVEFSAKLRMVDPLDELAYLDLECRHLGEHALGNAVRRQVLRALGDRPPFSLFCFYRCYRAMLRARLSIAHLLSPNPRTPEKWRPQALAYLRLAEADARCLQSALRRQGAAAARCPRAGT